MSDGGINPTVGRQDWGTWPRYNAAVEGFRNYWYPVMSSRKVRRRPVSVVLVGERIMFIRDGGTVYALHDRCLHRGIPLSLGSGCIGQSTFSRQNFPGTISCGYHGWTYDLKTGNLVAALTDGPDSPICGKVQVKTYPVEERLGMVWVYIGAEAPPPVENDIPTELLANKAAIGAKIRVRQGNWRYGAENGFDEAHARYLHRNSLWRFFNYMPSWTKTHVESIEDGQWLTYVADEVHRESEYPRLGEVASSQGVVEKGQGCRGKDFNSPAVYAAGESTGMDHLFVVHCQRRRSPSIYTVGSKIWRCGQQAGL